MCGSSDGWLLFFGSATKTLFWFADERDGAAWTQKMQRILNNALAGSQKLVPKWHWKLDTSCIPTVALEQLAVAGQGDGRRNNAFLEWLELSSPAPLSGNLLWCLDFGGQVQPIHHVPHMSRPVPISSITIKISRGKKPVGQERRSTHFSNDSNFLLLHYFLENYFGA